METIDRIPTSKIQRVGKIVSTGAKVGINYAKYYSNRLVKSEEEAKEQLHEDNADAIYDGLKNLKGSALKVAQMLSMDKNVMPRAFVEKFSLAQFSVPPLSPALVVKTFKKYFGKRPDEIFDKFSSKSSHAASIGQVHEAELDGKKLAIKIQYPGVADSISSDLAIIKPIALRMFNIKAKDSDQYFEEVRDKLLEETDYNLELKQGQYMAEQCSHFENMVFPNYYDNLSSDRIITMDWLDGMHLSEFTKINDDQELANKIGQSLWEFYMYQIHDLKMVQADPHPGNFMISDKGKLMALDFGCIKKIPHEFYEPYFKLSSKEALENESLFEELLFELEILKDTDTEKEKNMLKTTFHQLISLFTKPLQHEKFDFSDQTFFEEMTNLGEKLSKNGEMREINGNRGSRHFIYMNRTFFGLYHLMFDLQAKNITIGA